MLQKARSTGIKEQLPELYSLTFGPLMKKGETQGWPKIIFSP